MDHQRGHAPDREAIVKVLLAHAPPGIRDSHAIHIEGPTRTGRYSHIYRARIDGMPTPLVVKCLLDPASGKPDRASARLQFDVLSRVHGSMLATDPSYRVPKPYWIDETAAIVVVEWIDGRSMTELFLSMSLSVDEGRELVRRAARWLRNFAGLKRLSPAPLDVSDRLESIAAMEHTGLSRHRSAREAIGELRKHAETVGSYSLERSWLHGDFKTDNLLVDERSIVGIDVHAKHENAVSHDLAAFLNHWELTLCHPRAWRWRPWREALAREFLEAFDPAYTSDRRFPYLWIALYEMLGSWEEFIRRQRRTLQHLYLTACFRRVVRRMTRELAAAARLASA